MTRTNETVLSALVVGTGFGCAVHVPALRAAGFDVVGLVGSNAERTARRAEKCGVARTFTDLDEAIRETGATAVTIATPPHTHAALTLTALSHGCHVICEKPMAADTAEAQQLLDAAERAGVMHLIGFEFRWQPERAVIARAIADGLIGEPRFLTLNSYMSLVADPAAKMPHWWFDVGAGGGWLGAHGSHLVDQIRTWLGEFDSLSAVLPTISARSGGAEGTLWSEGGVVRLADRNGVRELPVPEALQPPIGADGKPYPLALGLFIRLCEVLRAGVEGRAPANAVAAPTFRDGLACMKVLDAIRASAARNGELVTL